MKLSAARAAAEKTSDWSVKTPPGKSQDGVGGGRKGWPAQSDGEGWRLIYKTLSSELGNTAVWSIGAGYQPGLI